LVFAKPFSLANGPDLRISHRHTSLLLPSSFFPLFHLAWWGGGLQFRDCFLFSKFHPSSLPFFLPFPCDDFPPRRHNLQPPTETFPPPLSPLIPFRRSLSHCSRHRHMAFCSRATIFFSPSFFLSRPTDIPNDPETFVPLLLFFLSCPDGFV